MIYKKLTNQEEDQQAQESLLSYMYPVIPMRCENQHCEYLMKVIWSLGKQDSVLSYNWDTIVDFTLQTTHATQLKNYAKLLRDEKISTETYSKLGLLLKLHGSFNWLICKNQKCNFYNRIHPPFQKNRYKLLKLRQLWQCPSCGGEANPFIVPPTSNKMIHKNSFLKTQWLIAREKLLDVKQLIFIGYSFPPTDYYSEWLFRQINFIEERPKFKVIIVNPEYGKKHSLVTKRFDKIFKGHETESYKTLEEYSEII